MARREILIRRRWWAHLITIYVGLVMAFIAGCMLFAMSSVYPGPGWWWKVPIFAIGAGFMVHGLVVCLNALLSYRVIVTEFGLRIRGNLYTHDIRWDEIAVIRKRHNFRVPGYHVEIQVDGSNNPQRHWCNYFVKGYFIHPGMEKGGKALAAYLNRKRRDNLPRSGTAVE